MSISGVLDRLSFTDGACTVHTCDGHSQRFDTMYPVLGCTPSTGFLAALQPSRDENGQLIPDAAMETSVPGLFAAGDVVVGLNQISVAVGQAAIAATRIHHRLPCNLRGAAVATAPSFR
ncbi:MAG: Alkyl hydroperoxide reductase subunit F [Luteibacter sp.]|uniref:FAD-dependent oxidoreductase n=1 Tax=Luteibacter sp. TaxID=1886636 RepID=UPI0013818D21|nr:FAD-dependent oxidoreductase [Luteibacter sp.]KAF1007400.1 MAG: Alkyl hydroperoxide reductase subunit F [Luteibacter sp.]